MIRLESVSVFLGHFEGSEEKFQWKFCFVTRLSQAA
jgi:hypothetical protein